MLVWRTFPGRADARPGAFLGLSGLPGFGVAFSTRSGGVGGSLNVSYLAGDDPARVLANRARVLEAVGSSAERWTSARQVHGTVVGYAGESIEGAGSMDPETAVPGADGLWTDRPGTPLAVVSADCVPVVVADPVRRRVAVVHAGWRGMVGGILEHAVEAMGGGTIAFVGPSIGPCCFEVGDEVAGAASHAFGDRVLARTARGMHVDLWLAARTSLAQAGVPDVWVTGLCTRCEPHRFFSHRAGSNERQATVAMIA